MLWKVCDALRHVGVLEIPRDFRRVGFSVLHCVFGLGERGFLFRSFGGRRRILRLLRSRSGRTVARDLPPAAIDRRTDEPGLGSLGGARNFAMKFTGDADFEANARDLFLGAVATKTC